MEVCLGGKDGAVGVGIVNLKINAMSEGKAL